MTTSEYVGLAEGEAIRRALLDNRVPRVRVAFRDGELQAVKTAHDPGRLNLHVEDGVVRAAAFG